MSNACSHESVRGRAPPWFGVRGNIMFGHTVLEGSTLLFQCIAPSIRVLHAHAWNTIEVVACVNSVHPIGLHTLADHHFC
jgi:hypothetical protein